MNWSSKLWGGLKPQLLNKRVLKIGDGVKNHKCEKKICQLAFKKKKDLICQLAFKTKQKKKDMIAETCGCYFCRETARNLFSKHNYQQFSVEKSILVPKYLCPPLLQAIL